MWVCYTLGDNLLVPKRIQGLGDVDFCERSSMNNVLFFFLFLKHE